MSHRIPQLNELLRQEIGELFVKEMNFSPNVFVTINKVDTAADLSQSKIFVSVLPSTEHEAIIKLLNHRAKHLQYLVAQKVVIRKIPRLIFEFDDSLEKASHIEQLIDKIHHQG